jgi:Lrp/AsnC family leucine-responsive transcriptional regulator
MLDDQDLSILRALIADARISLKDLAAAAGLSSPSTSERVRRLQERGVLRAFTAEVNAEQLGYALMAIVRVRPAPGALGRVQAVIEGMPEVVECDKVTGEDCFFVRLVARSMPQLDQLLNQLAELGQTVTSLVKSQPVARRAPPLQYVTARTVPPNPPTDPARG